ncbi:hypothetical protein GPALN_005024 [Globodera pallida]|nr:hypothetical protein GPALN_005024 [Globodera pallida]
MYLLQLTGRRQQLLVVLLLMVVASDWPPLTLALINDSSQSAHQPDQHGESSSSETVAMEAVESSPPLPTEQPPTAPSSPPPTPAAVVAADVLLHHQQQQQHPYPKRNYASKDCGAKVLYSNAEAENRGAILNDPERDDYMRNPCERAQDKFLIIELCETIQPTALEIANFELFSSSPRQFRLWGSERYPTQEWAFIGEFEALDNREVQPFNVLEHTSYAKFVKLELLSHYGMEHYCTLSTFRLYGTSMVDEYEAETVVVDAMQHQLDSVFGRTFSLPTNKNGEDGNGSDNDNKQSISTTTGTPMMTLVEDGQQQLAIMSGPPTRPNVAQRCRKCPRDSLLQCDWFCHVFFGPGHDQMTRHSSRMKDSSVVDRSPLLTTKERTPILLEFLNRISPTRSAFCTAASVPRPRTCTSNGVSTQKTTEAMPKSPPVEQQLGVNGQQQQQNQAVQQPHQGQTLTETANNSNNSISSETRDDADKREQKLMQQQQQQPVQQLQKPLLDAKVVEKGNLSPLPGTSSTHKESVFMKLNKRLTALEQNMSLSSEHLLELGRRCVSGAAREEDELKQQRERFSKEAERMAKQEATRVETDMKQKITELQREVRRLSQQLQSVQTTVVQATGTGGFFYRPMLSPVHGYSASDAHCRGEQACLVSGDAIMSTLPPMHSTSAAPYGSMPVAAHSEFGGKSTDGLWTTSQVLYLVLLVQLGTLVMLKLFRVLCDCVHQRCLTASTLPSNTTTTLTTMDMNAATSQHSLPLLNS